MSIDQIETQSPVEALPAGRALRDWLARNGREVRGFEYFIYRHPTLGVVSALYRKPEYDTFTVTLTIQAKLQELDGAYLLGNGREVRRLAAEGARPMLRAERMGEWGRFSLLDAAQAWRAATPIQWPPEPGEFADEPEDEAKALPY